MLKTKRYGWIPDLPHRRSRLLFPLGLALENKEIDMRPQCPVVYDQGDLGSCTANAAAGDLEFVTMQQGLPASTPSRLFIYYNERVIMGTVDYDSGATISDAIQTLATQGAPPESDWPYDIAKFREQPPAADYRLALGDLALEHNSVEQSATGTYGCLALQKPFIFGFTVYESFESERVARTGVVPMPGPDEGEIGGHAVMAVGVIPADNQFIVRNSWGADWGLGGYFLMPYDYLLNPDMASDFQMVQLVGKQA